MLYALEQLGSLKGRHVGVIGQGSIGLLFSYAAKALGARHVTGVDPVDRDAIGKEFGVDTVVRATSDRWVSHLDPSDRPDVVIEAVGHQVATLGHAVDATAPGGTVFYFGVPDDDSYPISMRAMLRNNLTLKSGVTLDRRRVLDAANEFAREHPELLAAYVTHTFGIDDVQGAFDLACRPGTRPRQDRDRRMTGRLQDALAAKQQIWGGWVVGPTIIGPEEFATAGYDYVGFDVQHGYLDDADVALLLRRLEHIPIATAVRLPSADPAPIGRVLDAGADAVIVAMIESADQAAAAVAATRYAPAGVRSFGPLRGEPGADPAAQEARASVFAMIETARGLSALDEICAVPGLAGVYVGPADLAISLGYAPAAGVDRAHRPRRHGPHPGRRVGGRSGGRHPCGCRAIR